jgi:hypothetical protein
VTTAPGSEVPLKFGWLLLVIWSWFDTPLSLAGLSCPVRVRGTTLTLTWLVAWRLAPLAAVSVVVMVNAGAPFGGALVYVWLPMTLTPPLPLGTTVPAVEGVPSPQLIVAMKLVAVADGFVSENEATTTPESG